MFKKKYSLLTLIVSVFLAILLTFQITFVSMREIYNHTENQEQLTQSQEASKLKQIIEMMQAYCIYDIDRSLAYDAALSIFLAYSGDPYAAYYTPEAYASMQRADDGTNTGIGITIKDDPKGIRIATVTLGSPAEEAGLLASDIITKLGQTELANLTYEEKAYVLLGNEGETAELTVLRGEQNLQFSIVRKSYESPTVLGYLLPDGKTGLVRIEQFNNTTPDAFKKLTSDLVKQGAEGFIYDLRDNPGGMLESIIPVLDYLLPEGRLVTLEDRSGVCETYDSDEKCFDYPAVILTSNNTASAAELFSACMRDYGAAILLGETTYGKGVAQTIVPLPDGSAIKFTAYRYYSPVTKNYDGVGLTPDIIVETPENLTDFAHSNYESDSQMQKAQEALWK